VTRTCNRKGLLPSDVAAHAKKFIAHAVGLTLSALVAIRSAMEKSRWPAQLSRIARHLVNQPIVNQHLAEHLIKDNT